MPADSTSSGAGLLVQLSQDSSSSAHAPQDTWGTSCSPRTFVSLVTDPEELLLLGGHAVLLLAVSQVYRSSTKAAHTIDDDEQTSPLLGVGGEGETPPYSIGETLVQCLGGAVLRALVHIGLEQVACSVLNQPTAARLIANEPHQRCAVVATSMAREADADWQFNAKVTASVGLAIMERCLWTDVLYHTSIFITCGIATLHQWKSVIDDRRRGCELGPTGSSKVARRTGQHLARCVMSSCLGAICAGIGTAMYPGLGTTIARAAGSHCCYIFAV